MEAFNNFFSWFLTHLAGGNWHSSVLEFIGDSTNLQDFSIIMIITFSLFLFFNLIQLVISGVDRMRPEGLIVYIPLALLYLIGTIVSNLIIISIGITIGGMIGFYLIGGLYFLFVIINAMQYWTDEEPMNGFFNYMRFTLDYSERAGDFLKDKKKLKAKYSNYLKIQYYEHD